MGNSNKKPQQEPQISNSILTNHIKNSNYNEQFKDDSISKFDRQSIYKIKQDLNENPELFVLNNVILGVMFFENYNKYVEDLKKELGEKHNNFIVPDKILEKVNENVLYRPHHGPNKHHSEPLVPKRLFILNDWVRVVGTTEDLKDDKEKTAVRLEDSKKKGFVRLRIINPPFQHNSGSPILRLESTTPLSRASEDSSEDGFYFNIQELRTPKPHEIFKKLENTQNDLPKSCISYRKIPKTSFNPDEIIGEKISDDDLYEKVHYVNSKQFINKLESELFLNGIASELGFDIENIYRSEQEKYSCIIKEGEKKIPCEIMPSIQASWPLDQTLIFNMKAHRTPMVRKRFIYPTASMIEEMASLGCVILPNTQVKKNHVRQDSEIEWELCFPQAQRYLETFMSHPQMKSLLVLLTLHKTYVEPKTGHSGLKTEHIRNFIIGECESNYTDWPEHRLGIKLVQVIKKLNFQLSKARPDIPDFFICNKNALGDVATPKIRKANKAYDEILQAPLMSFIKALRNLRYTNGRTFFPPFDFKKLYSILIKPTHKPNIIRTAKSESNLNDPTNLFERFEDGKRREQILRKRLADEQKEKEANLNNEERRGSVDSIDVEWSCEKTFDLQKKRAILKFFIETFLDISEKCLTISSKQITLLYIKQAYHLARILKEECPAFTDDALEYLRKISDLEAKCDKMKADNKASSGEIRPSDGSSGSSSSSSVTATTTNGTSNSNNVNGRRKTVVFGEDIRFTD